MRSFKTFQPVIAVNNKDKTLSSSIIMSPQWSDFVLASYVPDIEFYILVGYSFDIKAHSGDCCNRLVEFEFVKNSLVFVFWFNLKIAIN